MTTTVVPRKAAGGGDADLCDDEMGESAAETDDEEVQPEASVWIGVLLSLIAGALH